MFNYNIQEYNTALKDSKHYSDIIFDHYYYPVMNKIVYLEQLFQQHPDLHLTISDHEFYYSQQNYDNDMTIEHSCFRHIFFENIEDSGLEHQILDRIQQYDADFFSLMSGIEVGNTKDFDELNYALANKMDTFLSGEITFDNRIEKYQKAIDYFISKKTNEFIPDFIQSLKENTSFSFPETDIYGQKYHIISTDPEKMEQDYNKVSKNVVYKNRFLMSGVALNLADLFIKHKSQFERSASIEIFTSSEKIQIDALDFYGQVIFSKENEIDFSAWHTPYANTNFYRKTFPHFPLEQDEISHYLWKSCECIRKYSSSLEEAKELAVIIENKILTDSLNDKALPASHNKNRI